MVEDVTRKDSDRSARQEANSKACKAMRSAQIPHNEWSPAARLLSGPWCSNVSAPSKAVYRHAVCLAAVPATQVPIYDKGAYSITAKPILLNRGGPYRLTCLLSCRHFVDVLTGAFARLGVDVVRYTFIVMDLHHLLLPRLSAHSEAPWEKEHPINAEVLKVLSPYWREHINRLGDYLLDLQRRVPPLALTIDFSLKSSV